MPRRRLLNVLQGKSVLVVRGLREMATNRNLPADKRKTIATVCAYLENNRERMHYDQYLAKGYPIVGPFCDCRESNKCWTVTSSLEKDDDCTRISRSGRQV